MKKFPQLITAALIAGVCAGMTSCAENTTESLKDIHEKISVKSDADKEVNDFKKLSKKEITKNIEMLEKQMYIYAKELDFEKAAEIRDVIFELKGYLN